MPGPGGKRKPMRAQRAEAERLRLIDEIAKVTEQQPQQQNAWSEAPSTDVEQWNAAKLQARRHAAQKLIAETQKRAARCRAEALQMEDAVEALRARAREHDRTVNEIRFICP